MKDDMQKCDEQTEILDADGKYICSFDSKTKQISVKDKGRRNAEILKRDGYLSPWNCTR